MEKRSTSSRYMYVYIDRGLARLKIKVNIDRYLYRDDIPHE